MRIIITAFLFCVLMMTSAIAKENDAILHINASIYSQTIHVGDICFIRFTVTNKSDKNLLLPSGRNFGYALSNLRLLQGEKTIGIIHRRDHNYGVQIRVSHIYGHYFRLVKPNETLEFYFHSCWIPLPGDVQKKFKENLITSISNGNQAFSIPRSLNYYYHACLCLSVPKNYVKSPDTFFLKEVLETIDDNMYRKDRNEMFSKYSNDFDFNIEIKPRIEKVSDLLSQWYFGLPNASYTQNQNPKPRFELFADFHFTILNRKLQYAPLDLSNLFLEQSVFCK
jgi:hypothetical protein